MAGSIAVALHLVRGRASVDGTVRVVEALKARGEKLDYCVVGEPTCVARLGDMIKNGRAARSRAASCERRASHVAYHHLSRKPVHESPRRSPSCRRPSGQGNEYFPPTTWPDLQFQRRTGAATWYRARRTSGSTSLFHGEHLESLQTRVVGILDKHGVSYDLD